MMLQLLNEAFLVKITIIFFKFLRVIVNTYVPMFRGLDARTGRKLRTDPHTHTHMQDNHNNDNHRIGRLYK